MVATALAAAAGVVLPVRPAGALAARADEIFARTSPYPGDGLRNHCLRLFCFAAMIMDARGVAMPRDVLYLIAMVHDLGLVTSHDPGASYLERSLALLRRELAGDELRGAPAHVVDECLLYNHRLAGSDGLSPAAEALRCAVQIEHSFGLLRHGLGRDEVRAVFARYSRANFTRVLLDFVLRVLLREPWTVVRGIFW